jgi:serine/threonine protein kinase
MDLHRDLKPDNMLLKRQFMKLADFDIGMHDNAQNSIVTTGYYSCKYKTTDYC